MFFFAGMNEKGSVLTADKTVAIARRVRRKISGGEKKLRVKGWKMGVGSWELGVGSWELGVGSWELGENLKR